MAVYEVTCTSCGADFPASRRDAQTCSDRCKKRLQRGHRHVASVDHQTPDPGHSPAPPPRSGERLYAIYRGTLDYAGRLVVNARGEVVEGSFQGRRIGDVLRTAHERGWLAYRHRPDGWYSAEWWPEKKYVALCGPVARLPGARIEQLEQVAVE